jgi:hypothetical protein
MTLIISEENYRIELVKLQEHLKSYTTPLPSSSGGTSSPAGGGGSSSAGESNAGFSSLLRTEIPQNKYIATPAGSDRLKRALISQLNWTFSNPGPSGYIGEIGDRNSTPRPSSAISGLCAGYSYNIIKDLKKAWETNNVVNSDWKSSGNAYHNYHLANINNTGLYDMYYIGYDMATNWRNWVLNQSWNYGDVLNYRAINEVNTYSPDLGKGGYHTQVYTNDIYNTKTTYWNQKTNERKNETITSGWTTSNQRNYGASFVYKTGFYHMYVFKVKEDFLKG